MTDQPTDQPTEIRTWGVIGKPHFKKNIHNTFNFRMTLPYIILKWENHSHITIQIHIHMPFHPFQAVKDRRKVGKSELITLHFFLSLSKWQLGKEGLSHCTASGSLGLRAENIYIFLSAGRLQKLRLSVDLFEWSKKECKKLILDNPLLKEIDRGRFKTHQIISFSGANPTLQL